MPGHFEEHEHHIFHSFNRELTELYASSALRSFAISLVAIFEPIYLYNLFGGSFFKTFLYIGLIFFFTALLVPLGVKVLSRIGIKHTMLLSVPFAFVYYFSLLEAERIINFIFLLPIVFAIYNVLYWPAFHADFARFSDHKRRGRETSYRFIILSLMASIAPLLGGVIITQAGFPILFTIVLAILFASIVPLFLSKEVQEVYEGSYFDGFKEIFNKENRNKVLAFASGGAENVIQGRIWPLYLFVIGLSFETLGIVVTASMVIGMMFLLYIGRLSDRIGSARLLKIGSILNATLWPIKAFVTTPFTAFLAQTLHSFGRNAAYVPFGALFYDWASDEESREKSIVIRAISLNIFGAFTLFTFALFFALGGPMHISFFIAPIFALGFMFMIRKNKVPDKMQEGNIKK